MQSSITTTMPWLPRIAHGQLSAQQGSSLCAQWRAHFGAWKITWALPTSYAGLTYSAVVSRSSKPVETCGRTPNPISPRGGRKAAPPIKLDTEN
jgi:hypothetical protein